MSTALSQTARALQEQIARWEQTPRPAWETFAIGCPAFDRLLSAEGLRRGRLVELLGDAGSGAMVLGLIAAREACRDGAGLVVVDREGCFYPPAAAALGLDLSQIIFVRPRNRQDYLWSLNQALRCQGVGAVLSWPEKLEGRAFRSLQLAAETGGTVGLLVRPLAVRGQPTWSDLQLLVEPFPGAEITRRLKVSLLRCRRGTAGASVELELDDETGTIQESRAVHLAPAMAVAAAASGAPELRRREVVLYGPARGCLRVTAASGQHGIEVGVPLAEATARGAGHFEEHDRQADEAALVKLAGWCEQFSPLVGIQRPDNLCLNVTGLGPLFGGQRSLAQQVARALDQQSLVSRVAIADTWGAAWAAAHFGQKCPQVLPAGCAAEALAELPVAALRLQPKAIAILAELGIERIGQLLMLPRDGLAARFAPELLLRLDQATGLAAETIVSHRPPPEVVAEIQLECSTENRQTLEVIFSRLVDRVSQQLSQRQRGAIQMQCQLRCEGGQSPQVLVGLFRASAQPQHLLELVRLQLDRLTLPGPIVAVKVSVPTDAPLECWQRELFEPSHREGRRQVGLLVDRLSNRLGSAAVVRAVPQADAQPECAVRYEPLAGIVRRKTKEPRGKRLPRPLRLEKEPRALKVLSVVPHGPPIQFELGGPQRVARAWGPERIQTAWWRGRYVQRDYYRVETTTGKRFWLFRRLSDARWFLHGVFD